MSMSWDFQCLFDQKLREVQCLVLGEVERLSALAASRQAFPTLSQVDPVHPDVCTNQGRDDWAVPQMPIIHPFTNSVEPPNSLPMVLPMTVSLDGRIGSLYSASRADLQPPPDKISMSSTQWTKRSPRSFTLAVPPKTPPDLEQMDFNNGLDSWDTFDMGDDFDVVSRWAKLVADRWMKSNVCFLNDAWTDASDQKIPSVTNVVQSVAALQERNISIQRGRRAGKQSRWLDNSYRQSFRQSVKSMLNASPQSHVISVKEKVIEKVKPLHPFSPTRVIWDVIGVCMLGLDIIMMPLPVFNENTNGLPNYYNDFSQNLDIAAICYWTADMGVSFCTGFTATDGNVEMRPKFIAKQYLRRWFFFDLIVVLTDWTSLFTEDAAMNHGSMLRLARTALRLARLLRVVKMNKALNRLWMTMNSEVLLTVLGVAKLMLIIVTLNHYVACGWFWLGTISTNSWIDNKLHTDSATYAYFTSLHWSLTQFTPASMEVYPFTEQERCYNVVVIIVAMLTFSSFVSSITQAMTHLANTNKQKAQQEVAIRHYLFEHNISHQLTGRIWAYVRHSRLTAARRPRYSDIPSLMRMPDSIKKDLRVEIFLPVLLIHPMFDFYNLIDSNALASICRHAALETYLGAREEHLALNEIVKTMFAVVDGCIEYRESAPSVEMPMMKRKSTCTVFGKTVAKVDENGETWLVNSGYWACEIALWANAVRNTGTFQAAVSSEIVTINGDAFRHHALQHPSSVDVLKRYARLFVESFNKAGEEDPSNALFNNSKQICSMVQQCMEIDLKGKKLIGRDRGSMTSNRMSITSLSTMSVDFFRLNRRARKSVDSAAALPSVSTTTASLSSTVSKSIRPNVEHTLTASENPSDAYMTMATPERIESSMSKETDVSKEPNAQPVSSSSGVNKETNIVTAI